MRRSALPEKSVFGDAPAQTGKEARCGGCGLRWLVRSADFPMLQSFVSDRHSDRGC
jgi:hypothetical protein